MSTRTTKDLKIQGQLNLEAIHNLQAQEQKDLEAQQQKDLKIQGQHNLEAMPNLPAGSGGKGSGGSEEDGEQSGGALRAKAKDITIQAQEQKDPEAQGEHNLEAPERNDLEAQNKMENNLEARKAKQGYQHSGSAQFGSDTQSAGSEEDGEQFGGSEGEGSQNSGSSQSGSDTQSAGSGAKGYGGSEEDGEQSGGSEGEGSQNSDVCKLMQGRRAHVLMPPRHIHKHENHSNAKINKRRKNEHTYLSAMSPRTTHCLPVREHIMHCKNCFKAYDSNNKCKI